MSLPSALVARYYATLIYVANQLQSPFLLVVRLYWGWQFHQTGHGKLHNIPHVVQFFSSLGIPFPEANAWFIALLEVLGGLLLILGLCSRLIAIPLTIDMIVAYATADREALLSVFSDPGKFYNAAPFTFLMASLIVLIFGPGMFSLDYLIRRRRSRNQAEPDTRV